MYYLIKGGFLILILTAIPSIRAMYTSLRLQRKIKVRCPFQSLLLYNDHSIHGDNTEDEYDAIFQSSYNGWEHAMVTIYTLCQSKLTGSAKDVLETEQQQWLDMREQAALDTPIFLVTDMTKMRT